MIVATRPDQALHACQERGPMDPRSIGARAPLTGSDRATAVCVSIGLLLPI